MKAIAVFPKERRVTLIDNHPEPQITSPNQVKLKIIEVGICGTDREICSFAYGTPPEGSDYLVLGHESLGQVIEVGAGVTKFKPGDLVVTMVRRPCDHSDCIACRSGRQDFCYTGDYKERGIKGLHGFMTEFVVDEECYMLPAPQALLPIAVLTEPLTIAEKAMSQVCPIASRFPWTNSAQGQGANIGKLANYNRAAILGAGPVGLLGAMVFVNAGFNTFVYSLEAENSPHANIAKTIGTHYVSAQDKTIPEFAAMLGNVDYVFEATGGAKISFEMVDVLGINGIFAFTGVSRADVVASEPVGDIMRNLVLKNQALVGTVNAAKADYQKAIDDLGDFLAKWPALMQTLIVRFPMEQYETLLFQANDNFKNVLKIS
ncbi:MAG: gcd [Gammaproteobacteria bacterium]|jgi:threonine dehydrogenase-like Zn-dependent dehydrogenase|nr:gcd [Gammaproteobacteria bacterium]